MKKNIIFILLLTTIFSSINAQSVDVPNTKNPTLIKVTASWCTNCGSWGWNFFHDIYEDNSDKASVFAVHFSGKYKNNTAVDIANNFNVFAQPIFLFNGADQSVSSSNSSSKRSSISNKVSSNNSESPIAQTGIVAEYNQNNLTVNFSTKFFSSSSEEYYLGIYLVEKEFIGYQAARGNNAKHKSIIRLELNGKSFGKLINTESVSANDFFDGQISFDISNYDPKNIELVSIIWKKDGDKYSVVNSNSDKEVSKSNTSTTTNTVNSINYFNVYPTVISNNATITINSTKKYSNVNIDLIDITGRRINTIYSGAIVQGQNLINLNIDKSIPSANYFINLSNKKDINITKKIVIE